MKPGGPALDLNSRLMQTMNIGMSRMSNGGLDKNRKSSSRLSSAGGSQTKRSSNGSQQRNKTPLQQSPNSKQQLHFTGTKKGKKILTQRLEGSTLINHNGGGGGYSQNTLNQKVNQMIVKKKVPQIQITSAVRPSIKTPTAQQMQSQHQQQMLINTILANNTP